MKILLLKVSPQNPYPEAALAPFQILVEDPLPPSDYILSPVSDPSRTSWLLLGMLLIVVNAYLPICPAPCLSGLLYKQPSW
ncbi:hypothetical protein DSO57_1034637 [Entomophthora muscae]|uniref:Uncharacterized protein n=1 Tax=Entomophthora muscae TaxID=34485 RepID=A0ACC2RQS0_9FUNG|nr:hypothetical protein DSO57_1034637 [Entomophthora muscae]